MRGRLRIPNQRAGQDTRDTDGPAGLRAHGAPRFLPHSSTDTRFYRWLCNHDTTIPHKDLNSKAGRQQSSGIGGSRRGRSLEAHLARVSERPACGVSCVVALLVSGIPRRAKSIRRRDAGLAALLLLHFARPERQQCSKNYVAGGAHRDPKRPLTTSASARTSSLASWASCASRS